MAQQEPHGQKGGGNKRHGKKNASTLDIKSVQGWSFGVGGEGRGCSGPPSEGLGGYDPKVWGK